MRNSTPWLLAVLCAVSLLAGCEAIKEAVEDEVDTDFEKDTEFKLAPIALVDDGSGFSVESEECGSTSIAAEIAKNEIDLSDVEVDSTDLDFLEVQYRNASWTPSTLAEVDCNLTVNDVLIADVTVTGAEIDWTAIDLSDPAKEQVQHFLNPANWNETFSYCASCVDDPDTFQAEFRVNIGATIKGKVNID